MSVSSLAEFKQARIEALTDALKKKDDYISLLETFIFELTDKDCPEDYKRVVFGEIMKNK